MGDTGLLQARHDSVGVAEASRMGRGLRRHAHCRRRRDALTAHAGNAPRESAAATSERREDKSGHEVSEIRGSERRRGTAMAGRTSRVADVIASAVLRSAAAQHCCARENKNLQIGRESLPSI